MCSLLRCRLRSIAVPLKHNINITGQTTHLAIYTTMPPSENDIRSLIQSGNCYSASSIPLLEEYLAAALQGGLPYIADAVRTLIKLYQLFPAVRKQDSIKSSQNIVAALFLAFTQQAPQTTDYLALTLLLPPASMHHQPQAAAAPSTVSILQKLVDQWNACQFEHFWKTYGELLESDANLKAPATAAMPKLQVAVAQVLALTYRQAPVSLVQAAVNVSSASEISQVLGGKSSVVESIQNDMVVFTPSADNTKRQRVYQQGVNFAAVSALLSEVAQ